jgi:hypothetical protein
MKTNIKLLLLFCLLLAGKIGNSQNQKVWSGTSKLFGIDPTGNPGSSVTWTIGNGSSSTSSKADSLVATRAVFARYSWVNGGSNFTTDTIKVNEIVSGCTSTTISKLVDVYPNPILTVPASNQTICAGLAPVDFGLNLSNYAAITGIGTFALSYELRIGSASGTVFTSGNMSGINSGTVNVATASWPSMSAGTSYYFVVTNFGSEQSASGSNPAPGNVSATTIASFPNTYYIQVNASISAPSIQAY